MDKGGEQKLSLSTEIIALGLDQRSVFSRREVGLQSGAAFLRRQALPPAVDGSSDDNNNSLSITAHTVRRIRWRQLLKIFANVTFEIRVEFHTSWDVDTRCSTAHVWRRDNIYIYIDTS